MFSCVGVAVKPRTHAYGRQLGGDRGSPGPQDERFPVRQATRSTARTARIRHSRTTIKWCVGQELHSQTGQVPKPTLLRCSATSCSSPAGRLVQARSAIWVLLLHLKSAIHSGLPVQSKPPGGPQLVGRPREPPAAAMALGWPADTAVGAWRALGMGFAFKAQHRGRFALQLDEWWGGDRFGSVMKHAALCHSECFQDV